MCWVGARRLQCCGLAACLHQPAENQPRPVPSPPQVGFKTGWFGIAGGCDVAGAALQPATAKERAASSSLAGAASSSAALSVAGFPGQSLVAAPNGRLYFPLMGDQQCRAGGAQLCPAGAADAGDRMGGMLRHRCDTGKGMSGAPLWLQPGTPEARAAAGVAAAGGVPGGRPEGGAGRGGQQPAVAVGLVSRHVGDCPWGRDCENVAAPMDARALSFIKQQIARGPPKDDD